MAYGDWAEWTQRHLELYRQGRSLLTTDCDPRRECPNSCPLCVEAAEEWAARHDPYRSPEAPRRTLYESNRWGTLRMAGL